MSHCDYFKGKKITVMGLGVLGRGIADTAFLAWCGADLIVTDLKTKDQLKKSLKILEKYRNIQYVLGEHRLEDFQNRDMILKAAGVSLDSIYINEAVKNKIPVEMSASLVAQMSTALIVGVTGTRGKSTVTHLIYHILKTAGKDVHIGGNVRDVGTLDLLREAIEGDVIVMELDSWQLQGFGNAKTSPDIAVFTTFLPDHMNYYNDSMENYWRDKVNIFKYQTSDKHLIIGGSIRAKIQKENPKSSIIVASNKTLPKEWQLKILGNHNRDNAAIAYEVARILNVDENVIKKAVESFPGVPGRLEFVKEAHGVKIYNDNNSTTPEATIAGLKALGDRIILIMGGSDKGLDMSRLIKEIPEHCKGIVLFKGNGTDKISGDIKKISGIKVFEEEGLKACIKKAMSIAKLGDTLLYSPAFTSFGKYFSNEYDRGDQFMALAKKVMSDLEKAKKVYLIGMGGIGISALAQMLVSRGVEVCGVNDSQSPETLDELRDKGVKIDLYDSLKQDTIPELPSDADIFIYSVAWEDRGPKVLEAAQATKRPVMSYFEALGELSRSYKTIAISGTHGKTTTTAMLAHVLKESGLNPTAVVGSLVDFGSKRRTNFLAGGGEYLIVEACEYKRHFQNFKPHIFVITNIELDHPDYYKDLSDVQDAFKTVVANSHMVVCDAENENVMPVIAGALAKVIDVADYREFVPELTIIGEHNKENAAFVLAVSDVLKIPVEKVQVALKGFKGTWRRLEYRGKTSKGVHVYDDYAHHPTEIKASIKAVRDEHKDSKIIAIFEPHMYSRIKALLSDFATAFGDADKVIIAPIYAARERWDGMTSAESLSKEIGKHHSDVSWTKTLKEIPKLVADSHKGSVLLFMGAGDIYQISENMI